MIKYTNQTKKSDYESALVLSNIVVVVALLIIRVISPFNTFIWDIATILVSVVSLFISQWIIRTSAKIETDKASVIVAVGMSIIACIMIVISCLTFISL